MFHVKHRRRSPLLFHAETSLPAQLTSFVGRGGELARVAERLAAARLVTLTGPGGAGKTRLSIEAAGRHDGEVCFVPLAGVTDGADVPQAVLGALGLREAGLMPTAGDRYRNRWAGWRPRWPTGRCCWCSTTASTWSRPPPRSLAGLLAGCPALRILATSREALGSPARRCARCPR